MLLAVAVAVAVAAAVVVAVAVAVAVAKPISVAGTRGIMTELLARFAPRSVTLKPPTALPSDGEA